MAYYIEIVTFNYIVAKKILLEVVLLTFIQKKFGVVVFAYAL